jgi:predicted DNA-binding transcriptional regulator AlpA
MSLQDKPEVTAAPRVRVGEPLPAVMVLQDFESVLGLGHSRVWELYEKKAFATFEILPRLGGRPRFSGARVQAWIDGQAVDGQAVDDQTDGLRYFTSARRQRRRA